MCRSENIWNIHSRAGSLIEKRTVFRAMEYSQTKPLLKDVSGRDVGSEQNLRRFLEKEYYHEFEAGSFKSETEKEVTFVHTLNFAGVTKHMIERLQQVNELTPQQNIPNQELSLLLCGDEGSSETKLVMPVLQSKHQHSIKRTKLLAIFSGEKRYCRMCQSGR